MSTSGEKFQFKGGKWSHVSHDWARRVISLWACSNVKDLSRLTEKQERWCLQSDQHSWTYRTNGCARREKAEWIEEEECDTKSMWEICHNKSSPCLWFNKSKVSKLFLIEYSAIKNVKYKQSDEHLWSTTGSLSELTESILTAFINNLSALLIRIYLDLSFNGIWKV